MRSHLQELLGELARLRKKLRRSFTSQVFTLQTYQASYTTSKIKLVTADSFVSAKVIHFKILSGARRSKG